MDLVRCAAEKVQVSHLFRLPCLYRDVTFGIAVEEIV